MNDERLTGWRLISVWAIGGVATWLVAFGILKAMYVVAVAFALWVRS